jgi:chromosome segregation ATPase
MSVALLSYADLSARLNISREAARALARRRRLPRSRSEDGKALVSVDVAELRYRPRPRIGRQVSRQAGHIAASIAEIEALKIAALETAALEIESCRAEIARLETAAVDYRAEAQREWERANRLAAELQQAATETTAANERAARLALETLEIEACKAETARLAAATAGYKADFERERERADGLAAELQQAAAETAALNERAARLAIEASAIEACKVDIARLEAEEAGYRVVFERERERADRLAAELLQAAAETMAANERAAQLEDEVTALRSGGQGAGQAAHRLGRLAASIVQADRAARR